MNEAFKTGGDEMRQDRWFRNGLRVAAGTLGVLTLSVFFSSIQEVRHSFFVDLDEYTLIGAVLFGVCGVGLFGLATFRNWGRMTVVLSLWLYIPWRLGSLLRTERTYFKNVTDPDYLGPNLGDFGLVAPDVLAVHVFWTVLEEMIAFAVVLSLIAFFSSKRVKGLLHPS